MTGSRAAVPSGGTGVDAMVGPASNGSASWSAAAGGAARAPGATSGSAGAAPVVEVSAARRRHNSGALAHTGSRRLA